MHPDVPLERAGAAALFRLPSASGTSHLRSSKSSYQNRSLLLWMLPRWAALWSGPSWTAKTDLHLMDAMYTEGREKHMSKQVVYTALLYILCLLAY